MVPARNLQWLISLIDMITSPQKIYRLDHAQKMKLKR